MDIVFKNKKIDKLCNNQKLLVKEFGADRAKRIRRRLDDPLPQKPDDGLDWTKVSSVTIIGIEDTHD